MTSVEYGRHARRVLEWDEVEIQDDLPAEVDLTHGSVFQVDEDLQKGKESILGSVAKLLNRKIG